MRKAATFGSQRGVRGREGVFTECRVNGGFSSAERQAVIGCYTTTTQENKPAARRRSRIVHIHHKDRPVDSFTKKLSREGVRIRLLVFPHVLLVRTQM